jgi:hypothetical protein
MNVVFTDESRVNKGSAVEKAWKDTTLKLPHHFFFLEGLPIAAYSSRFCVLLWSTLVMKMAFSTMHNISSCAKVMQQIQTTKCVARFMIDNSEIKFSQICFQTQ